jgi:D-lactate dehydrogenase (cytochrome)
MKEIRSQLDEDTLSIEPEVLHLHGFSEWSHCNPSQLPVCVAYPQNTEEVSVIAKACHKYRIPMVGFSGGTSLEGNFSAPYGGMSIDFAFMDRIVKLNKEDLDIVVQPSVSWMDLNEEIAASGLFFPVDPGRLYSQLR